MIVTALCVQCTLCSCKSTHIRSFLFFLTKSVLPCCRRKIYYILLFTHDVCWVACFTKSVSFFPHFKLITSNSIMYPINRYNVYKTNMHRKWHRQQHIQMRMFCYKIWKVISRIYFKIPVFKWCCMNIERTYFHNGVEYIKSIMYKHMVNNGEINSGHGKWEGWLHVVHIQRKLTITINGIFFFLPKCRHQFCFSPIQWISERIFCIHSCIYW